MATFKVGQRVKRISHPMLPHQQGLAEHTPLPLGAEGIVTEVTRHIWVRVDGTSTVWPCFPHTLAPLLDPKADQFMETVKKWKPLYEPPRVGYLTKAKS